MLQLRPTKPADVPGILALIGSIFHEYDCLLDAENEDTHLLDPSEYFRTRGGEFWVVVDQSKIDIAETRPLGRVPMGTEILATVGFTTNGMMAELKSLYVHPRLRRQGWGGRLTNHVIENARAIGCTRLELWSDTRFIPAHELYRRIGFVQRGERELHDSNNSREYGFFLLLE